MGTSAVKTKKKLERFTYVGTRGIAGVMQAKDASAVEEKHRPVLIIKGTLRQIGAKRVEVFPESGVKYCDLTKKPQTNDICDLVVGDPHAISGGKFCGIEKLAGTEFLALTKDDCSYWTYPDGTYVTFVNGVAVETPA